MSTTKQIKIQITIVFLFHAFSKRTDQQGLILSNCKIYTSALYTSVIKANKIGLFAVPNCVLIAVYILLGQARLFLQKQSYTKHTI